ncbi:MAG: universal stress protein [Cyclobacteriaceae bacterium]|nr:universal stress protein [Cyclobacteriaceae bacterium]
MDKIKKLLVALDSSYMDRTLIPYAKFLEEKLPVEKIYFVNIIQNLNVPDEILKNYPDLIDNAIKEREDVINDLIHKYYGNAKHADIEIIIKTDQTTKFIMNFAHENDVDLIMMGRKLTLPTSSITIPRLARRANTNLLIIPEGAKPANGNFLVPIDFSIHSKLALQYAFDIANTYKNSTITCQNVYNVPTGYHFTGKSKGEFAKIMKTNAKKNFQVFFKDIEKGKGNVDFEVIYDLDDHDDLTLHIKNLVDKVKPDWVIIGAKGLTTTAALFLGSFAEKLIHILIDVPLFIARPKGGNEGLIAFLKEL